MIRSFESELNQNYQSYCETPPSRSIACGDHTFLCAGGGQRKSLLQSLSLFFSVSFHLLCDLKQPFQASIANVPNRPPLLMLQHYELLLCMFLSALRGLH